MSVAALRLTCDSEVATNDRVLRYHEVTSKGSLLRLLVAQAVRSHPFGKEGGWVRPVVTSRCATVSIS